MNEVPSERDDIILSQDHTITEDHSRVQEERSREVFETTINSETSFLPGQGAFASTPATAARIASSQQSFASQGSEDPSWTQSPLVKLSQELKAFSSKTERFHTSRLDSIDDESSTDDTSEEHDTIGSIPLSAKGKAKEISQPLLKSVLRHNLYSATENPSFDNKLKSTSPLEFKNKPRTPVIDKQLNPYLPSSGSSNWSGLVDLRDPSVLTPQQHRSRMASADKSATTPRASDRDDDDDSFDGLPPGMSPLVLMSPVRPPRSSAELGLLKLRQTPAKEVSERIQRNLIASALKSVRKSGVKDRHHLQNQEVIDSSMSTVPTPPSLSRYARRGGYSTTDSITRDTSLESMIRHVREDIQVRSSGQRSDLSSLFSRTPATPFYTPPVHHAADHSTDSDSDSLDSINNTAHPSAAFLMASGSTPAYVDDDSFGSSNHSSDSLENEEVNALGEGILPVHPFATNVPVVDDGFDDEDDDSSDGFETRHVGVDGRVIDEIDEDTVFGLVPAHRQSAAYDGQNIRMLGEELLQDTIGIGAQIAASGRIEESPTPANWRR